MNAAVVTLQEAAGRLRREGELEPSTYAWMISQLRGVTVELDASERRARKKNVAPADFAELLRETAAPLLNSQGGNVIAVQLPDEVLIEGPAAEIRDLLSCLIEYAGNASPNPIDLWAGLGCKPDSGREMLMVELSVRSPDVPDFIRRKLWDTARPRHGELSIVSEPDRCRIGLMLPVERRD
jgi:hypothetical protein